MSLDLSKVDFRVTPVENLFLDIYLQEADGDALRFYLYAWKKSYLQGSETLTLEEVQTHLHLSKEAAQQACTYWQEEGLLQVEPIESGWRFTCKSMLLLWAGLYDAKADGSPTDEVPYSQKDRPEIPTDEPSAVPRGSGEIRSDALAEGEARRRMIEELESFLSLGASFAFRFKPNELASIQDFLDAYPIRPEYFSYAYKKAHANNYRGVKTTDYILGILDNWVRQQKLMDEASLDAFLERESKARRPRQKKKAVGEFVNQDPRMSREERAEWVKKKLEASRKRSLRGGGQ